MCSHVYSVCYWLIGDALLMYTGVVSLRLHLSCLDVCWSFGVAGWGGTVTSSWSIILQLSQ